MYSFVAETVYSSLCFHFFFLTLSCQIRKRTQSQKTLFRINHSKDFYFSVLYAKWKKKNKTKEARIKKKKKRFT